jgi:hypothetical protein
MVPVITSLLAVLEVVNEFVESPLSDIAARRTEPKVLEISSGGNVEAEQTGVVTEDHTNDLPKALKRGILNALTSTRKILKKERTIPQESSDVGPPGETTIAEEHGYLVITPLFDVLPSQVFAEVTLLSNSDRENE